MIEPELVLTIPKSPYRNLTQLSSLGLAILSANITKSSVELIDRGGCYQLGMMFVDEPVADITTVLDEILRVPSLVDDTPIDNDPIKLGNLEGLLTAFLSYPGNRITGSNLILSCSPSGHKTNTNAIIKVTNLIERTKNLSAKRVRKNKSSSNWFVQLLTAYTNLSRGSFQITQSRESHLTIPVTMEPALGHAARHLLNLNNVRATNMTIINPVLLDVLAHIGAARSLRSQQVASDEVNIYLPFFSKILVEPDFTMPHQYPTQSSAITASVTQWLTLHSHKKMHANIQGLGFITIHLSKSKIFVKESGYYDSSWLFKLDAIKQDSSWQATQFWTNIFQKHTSKNIASPEINLNLLENALLHPHSPTWWRHLVDHSFLLVGKSELKCRKYSMEEIKLMASELREKTPLALLLDFEQGTGVIRLGRALRSVMDNKSKYGNRYAELVAKFQAVKNEQHLMYAIADLAMFCRLIKETHELALVPDKNDLYLTMQAVDNRYSDYWVNNDENPVPDPQNGSFVVIPNEDDFLMTIQAVEKHDPANIAALIIVLSTLYYPKQEQKYSQEIVNNDEQ